MDLKKLYKQISEAEPKNGSEKLLILELSKAFNKFDGDFSVIGKSYAKIKTYNPGERAKERNDLKLKATTAEADVVAVNSTKPVIEIPENIANMAKTLKSVAQIKAMLKGLSKENTPESLLGLVKTLAVMLQVQSKAATFEGVAKAILSKNK